eukprot:TRINITY_DN4609_c0_g1_i1.p1 TRINITY_DN4609_c0_g1~~TRINITY_DN4609_c0_g1_i1.p1  ORF type:complete len:599 (-),score=81.18 TRINITY_DN4609_c0_g1_i1:270-2066(-)
MKIVTKMQQAISEGRTFFSFEFFPPKTQEGVENLFERMDRMVSYGPTFCDITWGAGGSTADLTLDIAEQMQNLICVQCMMHLTCTNMPAEKFQDALDRCKAVGIQNILALRGDPPAGQDKFEVIEGGYSCALDLVQHIRKHYGDYFGICVSGYPEAHPDGIFPDDPELTKQNYWKDLEYLKKKVDAGAEFVITQLFYDVERFLQFVKDARSLGIECPIVPGIMPIMTYNGFKKMTMFCKTQVPKEISDKVEELKDNDAALKEYGIELGYQMCKRILDEGIPGLHMYTLNLERSAVGILRRLGLIDDSLKPRALPWRPATAATRAEEKVRPIYWSNRPKSYIKRTQDWDSYPRGRWGDSTSPSYGTLSDYQFMRRHTNSEARKKKALAAWGASLSSVEDIKAVFLKYCKGEIEMFPWAEVTTLRDESSSIVNELLSANNKGYLTINSQPQVNGKPSSDAGVGWGGVGGYVYQKAYIEFFVAPDQLQPLLDNISNYPSITYMAVNSKGDIKSNQEFTQVNAVTWGVFPGKEIIQPTVVEPNSFMVWKDEAFELWITEWGNLYEESSDSWKILKEVQDNWWLVSVVENDYIGGDLFKALGI